VRETAVAVPWPREEVRKIRPDSIIATGRSDYPNQVNNVLCFPFLFRGALDCGATSITLEMRKACVDAIARLARAPVGACSKPLSGDTHRTLQLYYNSHKNRLLL